MLIKKILAPGPLRTSLIVAFVFFTVLILGGFFALPHFVKSVLTEKLAEALKRPVSIEQVKINPLDLSITINRLDIKDKDEAPFISFEKFYANAQLSSVFKLAPVISHLHLIKPRIHIVRSAKATFNFSDLIPEKKTRPDSAGKTSPRIPKFIVRDIKVESGALLAKDNVAKSNHALSEINIHLPWFSSLPGDTEVDIEPAFQARLDDSLITLAGKSRPFSDSLQTDLNLKAQKIDLTEYIADIPIKLKAKILEGYASADLKLKYTQKDKETPFLAITGPIKFSRITARDHNNQKMAIIPEAVATLAESNLLARNFHIASIEIRKPDLAVTRWKSGKLNLLDLFPLVDKVSEIQETPAEKIDYSLVVDSYKIEQGRMELIDQTVDKPFQTVLDPIDIQLQHFSTAPENETAYVLSLSTDKHETVTLKGSFRLQPHHVKGFLSVDDIAIASYAPYYKDFINFEIVNGNLDVHTAFDVDVESISRKAVLQDAGFSLQDLTLKHIKDGGEFVRIPTLTVENTKVDLPKKEIRIGKFSTGKGYLFCRRSPEGSINFMELVDTERLTQTKAETTSATSGSKDSSPWSISLAEMEVNDYTLGLEDRVPFSPVKVTLSSIHINADSLATSKDQNGSIRLSAIWNEKGTLAVDGIVNLKNRTAELTADIQDIDIMPLQPYIADRVNLLITEGRFFSAGRLLLSTSQDNKPVFHYRGNASLNRFASLDKEDALDFLKWEALFLDNMDIDLDPLVLKIDAIALTGLYSRIIIDTDGSINLRDVLTTASEAGSTMPQDDGKNTLQENKTSPPRIIIGTVTLQNGHINFSDFFTRPNFDADLTSLSGRVSGLSSIDNKPADVLLEGRFENTAPLEIAGKINPFPDKRFVDLKFAVKDIDLSPFTPYAGKYIGYSLEKGKLGFDLKYKIEGTRLTAQNFVYIDQLDLGEKVDSPEATNLPVGLAISLLKDSSGRIDLDVPIEGNLDDPDFSLGKTILRMIGNLIVKIISAPFAWLGNAFGGGEELHFLTFNYGSETIVESETKKLSSIITALQERPSLKLEIEGEVNPEKDSEALRKKQFDNLIKAQKKKEMITLGMDVPPTEKLVIETQEYGKYLTLAYQESTITKPRDERGNIKALPNGEMEKLLYTHIQISEDDLRRLAFNRSNAVQNHFLSKGQITSERLFILEPNITPSADKDKTDVQSRVVFKIK
ncbi:DUF748 domain-containing protein [Thermodesulfobacteriota bacterium]